MPKTVMLHRRLLCPSAAMIIVDNGALAERYCNDLTMFDRREFVHNTNQIKSNQKEIIVRKKQDS